MIKADCLYYEEAKDMGATVHWCKANKEIIATCSWCDEYVKKDLVQVVRCKDCKHSFGELATRGGVWSTDDKHLFCQMTKHLMRVDDFCSWGERREDD